MNKAGIQMAAIGIAAAGLLYGPTTAADGAVSPDSVLSPQSVDDFGLALMSPVNGLWSLGNEIAYQAYQGSLPGADDQNGLTYRFRPSLAWTLDSGRSVMFRFTVPVYFEQPTYRADREYPEFLIRQLADTMPTDGNFRSDHNSLANSTFDIAMGGISDNGFIRMFGIAGEAPTARDKSARRDQYLLGPEAAFGKITSWGLLGAWLTHLTNVSGDEEYDTSLTSLEVFFAYGLGNGWQVFSRPVIRYDWEAASGNALFLPVGGGIARTLRFGGTPLRLALEVQYFAESPDAFGPEWLATFSATPVIGNPFAR